MYFKCQIRQTSSFPDTNDIYNGQSTRHQKYILCLQSAFWTAADQSPTNQFDSTAGNWKML